LKIIINVADYVDTVKVFVDGENVKIKKLSLLSNARFECDVESGVHEIRVVKHSEIIGKEWKKTVLYDWISALFSVPDFTLAERNMDTKEFSTSIKINSDKQIQINLKLTPHGFEIIDRIKEITNISEQTAVSKTAIKRVKYAYKIPTVILSVIIEIFFLSIFVFLFVNLKYKESAVVLCLFAFWTWLIIKLIKNNY